MNAIYLDHAAATPLHPDVLEAMLPYLTECFGNPSSLHAYGREAHAAVTGARDALLSGLGGRDRHLIFTSGGTESDNLALFGIAAHAGTRNHIITTQVEHHAVLHTCAQLTKLGFDVTYLPVDRTGQIRPEELERAIRPETCLISVMYGNNEVGTLQPIKDVARIAKEQGILLHSDAVQAFGKTELATEGISLLTVSAHKINGPKGVGALVCSTEAFSRLSPMLYGGSQERKRRAGTENVAGIAGFAAAWRRIAGRIRDEADDLALLRDRMLAGLMDRLGDDEIVVNGHPDPARRLPHILNVSFPGIHTETMLMNLDLEGVAAASGSACTSGSLELSHVLQAMKLPEEIASSAVRFSFGYGNTPEQIDTAAQKIATVVRRLRSKN